MRFILAALAAFLVLMLDFDQTNSSPGYGSAIRVSDGSDPGTPNAILFATRFMASVVASEALTPVIADEQSSPQPDRDAVQAPSYEFCAALKNAAEDSDIPVAFFARLLWQESRFRANEVSTAGAQGIAQFMPQTALEVGLDDPFDPSKALPASARLLRKLRDDFGNLGLAAAAYNAGSGRIQKWLARQSSLPRETRDYVRIITGTDTEDWIDDRDQLAIRADLPRGAPCEGVGGLSKARDVTVVPALPGPGVARIIRLAEAGERAASALRRARKLAVLLHRSRPAAVKPGLMRQIITARAKAKTGRVRVASRARSSS